MSEVATKVWMRGRRAYFTASQHRSMSINPTRLSPQMIGAPSSTPTWRATSRAASKSSSEEIGKPASITSTLRRASCRAISSFSPAFIENPGACSPSRSVVSKMSTRSMSHHPLAVVRVAVLPLDRRGGRLPTARPQRAGRAAQHVGGEEQEQEPLGMGGHDQHPQHHQHQHPGGPAAGEVDLLEAVVAEGGHHQDRHQIGPRRDDRPEPAGDLVVTQEQHHRGHDARRGRDRQPDEVATVGHARVDVEAGEAQGAADREHEGAGHPERDHVGEGIELHPELGRGLGEPGHLAVQHVQDHRHEERDRPLDEAGLGGQDQGQEPAEQVAGGEQARQQEDSAPRLLAQLLPLPPPGTTPRLAGVSSSHRSTPITDSPPRTRSPTRTRISVEPGTTRYVREPKRISPYRWPARRLSPGRTRHTMRRASTPAICLTATRPVSPSTLTVQRSLSSDASGRYAAMNRPGAYSTFFTRPPTGARLTWTSSGDRKIDTRTAGPTHGSIASVTTITRPSAGATTAPGRAGGVRSGSRKKPRQASAATMKTAAAAHQPIQPMIHAAAARGRMNGHPSEATGTRNRKPAD